MIMRISAVVMALVQAGQTQTYREINSMREVRKYMRSTKRTLFVFDNDNTLTEPVGSYGGDQWFEALIARGEQQGLTRDVALERLLPYYYDAQRRIMVKPVECTTVHLIKQIQRRLQHKVICLTARSWCLADVTFQQLCSVGIDFGKNSSCITQDIIGLPHTCVYKNDAIFCTQNDKGVALQACREQVDGLRDYERLIFVDDKLRHVVAVERMAAAYGLAPDDCICLHYTRLNEKVKNYTLLHHDIPQELLHPTT